MNNEPKIRSGRLIGWQAIADYLEISLTTARDYHDEFGMPVIRVTGPRVWTTPQALDTWVLAVDRLQRRVEKEIRWEQIRAKQEAR